MKKFSKNFQKTQKQRLDSKKHCKQANINCDFFKLTLKCLAFYVSVRPLYQFLRFCVAVIHFYYKLHAFDSKCNKFMNWFF